MNGSDVNAADYDGRTPLHIAASYGHVDVVDWLVEHGAVLDCRDSFGLTPLAEAMRLEQTACAKKLAALGAEATHIAQVQLQSETQQWTIKTSEISNKRPLCQTLKSSIFRAEWRGLQIVVKSGIETKNKKMRPEDKKALEEELVHEIKLLSTLRHPDLVMFLGASFDNNPPFFVTEYMQGGDLERYYKTQAAKNGSPYRPNADRLLRWSSAIARALCFLHNCSRPIVHRDLKPLNLLLTQNEELKVTDFGISKLMLPKAMTTADELEPEHDEAKMSGGVGTWRYMAPEVVRFEQYTDRVDVYSFALIFWFMATGQQPFVKEFGRDAEVVLKTYLRGREPRPNVKEVKCGCGEAVRELISDCWRPTPSSRPSAHACVQRLAGLCASAPGLAGAVKSGMGGLQKELSGHLPSLRPRKRSIGSFSS